MPAAASIELFNFIGGLDFVIGAKIFFVGVAPKIWIVFDFVPIFFSMREPEIVPLRSWQCAPSASATTPTLTSD